MSGVLVCLFLRFFCRSFLFIVIFLLIFEVFSADLFFFSNPIINLTYLCIFWGPIQVTDLLILIQLGFLVLNYFERDRNISLTYFEIFQNYFHNISKI